MGRDMEAVARHYISNFRSRSAEELESFQVEQTLEAAVRRAARSERPDGRRYSHQQRRRSDALLEAEVRLAARVQDFLKASSHADVYAIVNDAVKNVDDIGELYIYDASLRIGAKLGHLPKRVYLHSGTRDGAKALELEWRRACLDLFDFPVLRRHLEAHEIEDVLCIYKRYFKGERDLEDEAACWSDEDFTGC